MKTKSLILLATSAVVVLLGHRAPAAEGSALLASDSDPKQRAGWQQRFTLGPGDVLNFSLFDTNVTTRTQLIVGPDGRLSFLEAENVTAAGLTIDELRARFDSELARYYRNPHTIITPVEYRSKKYVVMGAVVAGGVFPMDRPVSVIEAVARAGGLETGTYQGGAVDLVDLSRCFLARKGERVSLDFERLFQRGDMTQNVSLEPDDYLYLGLASANEIYVLGQVASPGVLTFAPKPTVIGAIASRGGFTGKAYKSRVLVIRGSLTNPRTFVVDTSDILAGKTPDFKLEQKDIVYVSVSPWMKAAEVLDTAATAFISAMTVEAVSDKIGPMITSPIIK